MRDSLAGRKVDFWEGLGDFSHQARERQGTQEPDAAARHGWNIYVAPASQKEFITDKCCGAYRSCYRQSSGACNKYLGGGEAANANSARQETLPGTFSVPS